MLLITLHTIEAERQPVVERKVNGFIEVELSEEIDSARKKKTTMGALTPWLNPAWYDLGHVMTNSPGRWLHAKPGLQHLSLAGDS